MLYQIGGIEHSCIAADSQNDQLLQVPSSLKYFHTADILPTWLLVLIYLCPTTNSTR